MRKIIWGLVVAIIVIFVGAVILIKYTDRELGNSENTNVTPTPTPTPTTSGNINQGMNNYTSPDKYGFSIDYSESFGFTTDINQVKGLSYIPVCDEKMVACVFIKKEDYPGTNFDGAGVSINMLNTELRQSWTEFDCYNFKDSTNSAQNEDGVVKINGVDFRVAHGGDAGAGHSQILKLYRNFHNGLCYEIAAHVGSTSIGNYEPGTVKQFDEAKVWERLQNVVNSFIFTKQASANVSFGSKITITGTTVCLPHKNVKPGQPQTMECAIGLKDDNTGKFYGLKNSKNQFFDTNVKVKVEGILTDDSQSNYDTVGSIEVNSLVRI
jgi:hypothetical protein